MDPARCYMSIKTEIDVTIIFWRGSRGKNGQNGHLEPEDAGLEPWFRVEGEIDADRAAILPGGIEDAAGRDADAMRQGLLQKGVRVQTGRSGRRPDEHTARGQLPIEMGRQMRCHRPVIPPESKGLHK